MQKLTLASAFASLILLSSSPAFASQTVSDCQVKSYQMALRYQQQSAEINALQLQTFHFATQILQQKSRKLIKPAQYAVVIDLDETVLDNSPLLVRDMQQCHDFNQWDTWDSWETHGQPTLIPGAKAFLHAADQLKLHIFYVSDRSQKNKAITMARLKALGLPQVNDDQVLLNTASKQIRRESIASHYSIIMLLGDSLPDLDSEFKNQKSVMRQRQLVNNSANHFGEDWIVLPNAAYGAWEQASLNAWQSK